MARRHSGFGSRPCRPRSDGRALQLTKPRFEHLHVHRHSTGTRWLVEDRCDKTTRVRVFIGVVSVRDAVRNRRVTLREGDQYVAPGPRRRR